jgi:alpha-glucosidase (family GH31 glycosyl hydrolase)
MQVHPAMQDPPGVAWEVTPPRSPAWRDAGEPVHGDSTVDGVISVELHAPGAAMTGVSLERGAGERFFGFGVRSDEVARVDGVVECWVGEGPYQLEEYGLVESITPRWAVRRRRDAAYYPVPWAISSAGYGVLVENDELSRFRLDAPDVLTIEVFSDRLRLLCFAGPEPADALHRFVATTGAQPYPRAAWFLGPWISTGQSDFVPLEREAEILDTMAAAGAAVAAVETHMRRLPAGAHEGRRDAERARTALFHQHGLASLTYLNPFVSEEYAARFERAAPLLQRREDGTPYLYPAYIGGREPPVTMEGQLDFTGGGARQLFADLAREAIEDGHDGWMEDFGEYTPVDAVGGASMHNAYPTLYHAAGADAAAQAAGPIARFGRSGWTGTARHLPLVWGGDPTTGWGFDGLQSALTQALSAGLSGIAFFGSDIGGFFTLGDQRLDDELLIRWIQLGALSPLMRTKAEGVAIPPYTRPQVWDPQILPHWRRWAGLHVRLRPYLLDAAKEYVETGMPLMRHMCLVGGDAGRSDQYLLGPDLLVAPVLEPGARDREIALPPGRWIDHWRGAGLDGGRTVVVPAPLDEIPILVREGAVVPGLATA